MRRFDQRAVILLSICAFLLSAATITVRQFITMQRWHKEHRAIETMIHALRPHVPSECTHDGWRTAVHRTEIAFDNIAYDQTYVSVEELMQLRLDLEAIVAQAEISPSLLYAIYDRIGRCNKTTAEKSEKWREDVTEFIEQSYKITDPERG